MTVPSALTVIGTQIAVGGGLFYGVVKFFDVVGDKLNDDTRLKIAVWLLDMHAAPRVASWPSTFGRVFDRVFGERHLSWRCFYRSWLISSIIFLFCSFIQALWWVLENRRIPWMAFVSLWLPPTFAFGGIPDYVSLLSTRFVLMMLSRTDRKLTLLWLLFDLYISGLILSVQAMVGISGIGFAPSRPPYGLFTFVLHSLDWWARNPGNGPVLVNLALKAQWLLALHPIRSLSETFGGPAFMYLVSSGVTSIWLWLYAGAGFLLKGARRFDALVGWMNRRLDIEKKPLQSIGLVAGAIVALVYWTAVVVMTIQKV